MQDLADFAVKYLGKNGASYAEAKYQEIESNSFLVKNGSLDITSFDVIKGVGIRFILNKRLGFLSTNLLDKAKLIKQLKDSIKMCNKTKTYEDVEFSDEKTNKANYKVIQKIKLNSISPEEKIKVLMNAEKEMRSADAKVESTYMSLNDLDTKSYYVNSDGSKIKSSIPSCEFVYVIGIREGSKKGTYVIDQSPFFPYLLKEP